MNAARHRFPAILLAGVLLAVAAAPVQAGTQVVKGQTFLLTFDAGIDLPCPHAVNVLFDEKLLKLVEAPATTVDRMVQARFQARATGSTSVAMLFSGTTCSGTASDSKLVGVFKGMTPIAKMSRPIIKEAQGEIRNLYKFVRKELCKQLDGIIKANKQGLITADEAFDEVVKTIQFVLVLGAVGGRTQLEQLADDASALMFQQGVESVPPELRRGACGSQWDQTSDKAVAGYRLLVNLAARKLGTAFKKILLDGIEPSFDMDDAFPYGIPAGPTLMSGVQFDPTTGRPTWALGVGRIMNVTGAYKVMAGTGPGMLVVGGVAPRGVSTVDLGIRGLNLSWDGPVPVTQDADTGLGLWLTAIEGIGKAGEVTVGTPDGQGGLGSVMVGAFVNF